MNVTPMGDGTAHFTPGVGEQHTGPRPDKKKILRKKINEMVEQALLERKIQRTLNEQSYTSFRQTVTQTSPRQQMTRSLKEVNKKLKEAQQLMSHMNKLRQNLSEADSPVHDQIREQIRLRLKEIYLAFPKPQS